MGCELNINLGSEKMSIFGILYLEIFYLDIRMCCLKCFLIVKYQVDFFIIFENFNLVLGFLVDVDIGSNVLMVDWGWLQLNENMDFRFLLLLFGFVDENWFFDCNEFCIFLFDFVNLVNWVFFLC